MTLWLPVPFPPLTPCSNSKSLPPGDSSPQLAHYCSHWLGDVSGDLRNQHGVLLRQEKYFLHRLREHLLPSASEKSKFALHLGVSSSSSDTPISLHPEVFGPNYIPPFFPRLKRYENLLIQWRDLRTELTAFLASTSRLARTACDVFIRYPCVQNADSTASSEVYGPLDRWRSASRSPDMTLSITL